MGDAGSLFLGFLLAVIGLKLRFESPPQVTFLVPILVLGIPIFDTVLVVTTRLMHRLSPIVGGRDHMSHRLVFVGIPVPAAVSLIYAAAIALGWLAIAMSRVDVVTAYILGGFVVAVGLFLGVLLALVPVYESSRRRKVMLVEVEKHEEEEGSSAIIG
jgi:UDP-GlcNAc:undecaprenyl-phosphate GlcNAc-1-phosphate transferase